MRFGRVRSGIGILMLVIGVIVLGLATPPSAVAKRAAGKSHPPSPSPTPDLGQPTAKDSSAKMKGKKDTGAVANYVALGDSYSAGTGLKQPFGDSICARSKLAFPWKLTEMSKGSLLPTEDRHVACEGAKTPDIGAFSGPEDLPGRRPPQVLFSLTKHTKIVTVTIGGNDMDFAGLTSIIRQPPERAAVGTRKSPPDLGECLLSTQVIATGGGLLEGAS